MVAGLGERWVQPAAAAATLAAAVSFKNSRRSIGASGTAWVWCGHTAAVRLTDFWGRMRQQFGEAYVDAFSRSYVFSDLGGRTVHEALAQGVPNARLTMLDAAHLSNIEQPAAFAETVTAFLAHPA